MLLKKQPLLHTSGDADAVLAPTRHPATTAADISSRTLSLMLPSSSLVPPNGLPPS
jgi:hypothetical protein